MSDKLEILDKKVNKLLLYFEDISARNKRLLAERNKLLEKNSVVHSRVQGIIKDIRTIEGQN